MEINGKKTAPQRARVLREYRESPNPAVLIVSNVGIAGLNLDCANILIIAVSLLILPPRSHNILLSFLSRTFNGRSRKRCS